MSNFWGAVQHSDDLFFDSVWGMLDFLCVHIYNLIHRGSKARYGKSPTEAGLYWERKMKSYLQILILVVLMLASSNAY